MTAPAPSPCDISTCLCSRELHFNCSAVKYAIDGSTVVSSLDKRYALSDGG